MYQYSKGCFRIEIGFLQNPRSLSGNVLCLQGCEGCEIRDPCGQSIPHPDSERGERTHPTGRGGNPGRAKGMRGRQVSQACRPDQFLRSRRMWVALTKNPTHPSTLSGPLDTHLVAFFCWRSEENKKHPYRKFITFDSTVLNGSQIFAKQWWIIIVFWARKTKIPKQLGWY